MCATCYKTSTEIKAVYGIQAAVLSETKNGAEKAPVRCFYIIHAQSKTQTIVVCASLWDALSTPLKEKMRADDATHDDEEWGNTNAGLYAALQLDTDVDYIAGCISRFLKKDYDTYVVGHSLGGTLATLYAMRLHTEGYNIHKLVTFGQPKVIKQDSLDKCKELSGVTLRVIDVNDPVPHHFSGYTHVGGELVFFNRTDYTYTDKPGMYKNKRKKETEETLDNRLLYNQMGHYSLMVKQKMRMTGAFRKSIMVTPHSKGLPVLV